MYRNIIPYEFDCIFTINKINNNSVLTYNYVVFSFPPKVLSLRFHPFFASIRTTVRKALFNSALEVFN